MVRSGCRHRKQPSLTLGQQLTAAGGHHGAVFGGLAIGTRRQLDVIAAVTAHEQAGQEERKSVYTHVQTYLTHIQIWQTGTQIISLSTS